MRVLVADPDGALGARLEAAFVPLTPVIRQVRQAWELLDALAWGERFDVVVTDVVAPGPDGIQVCAMARTAGLALLPFVIIGPAIDARLRSRAARVGRVALVAKPVDITEVVRVVRTVSRAWPSSGDALNRRRHAQ